jgi:hypothetical protein
MRCRECYSENSRITPLKGAQDCLANHRQYICSTCGRIICIDVKGEKRARCFMPFSSKDIALLYLKCAEILTDKPCGIYELIYKRGDKRYRIFQSEDELKSFLRNNGDVKCENTKPIYINEKVNKIENNQIKYLTEEEIKAYLLERKELGISDK